MSVCVCLFVTHSLILSVCLSVTHTLSDSLSDSLSLSACAHPLAASLRPSAGEQVELVESKENLARGLVDGGDDGPAKAREIEQHVRHIQRCLRVEAAANSTTSKRELN